MDDEIVESKRFTKKLRDKVFDMAFKEDLTNGDLVFLDLLYAQFNEEDMSAKQN